MSASTAAPPLSHHEILAVVGPFVRQGHHVDLAATDRLGRLIKFKSVERPCADPPGANFHEALELRNPEPGTYRLTRTLTLPDSVAATLEASGEDPAKLLREVGAIGAQRHFTRRPGVSVARDYRIAASGLMLTRGVARIDALVLTATVPTVRGEPIAIELHEQDAASRRLPSDLLAVLGREWSKLETVGTGWRGKLRLAGAEPDRSQRLEALIERAARHVADTLAAPPEAFHGRWAWARWRVYARGAMPLLGCLLLIAATAALPRAHLSEHSALRMLIFNLPPLLMGVFFCLREIPRIELPPLPRRLSARAWPVSR